MGIIRLHPLNLKNYSKTESFGVSPAQGATQTLGAKAQAFDVCHLS